MERRAYWEIYNFCRAEFLYKARNSFDGSRNNDLPRRVYVRYFSDPRGVRVDSGLQFRDLLSKYRDHATGPYRYSFLHITTSLIDESHRVFK